MAGHDGEVDAGAHAPEVGEDSSSSGLSSALLASLRTHIRDSSSSEEVRSLESGKRQQEPTSMQGTFSFPSSGSRAEPSGSEEDGHAPERIHPDGQRCDPCVLFTSRYFCAKGSRCKYCHIHSARDLPTMTAANRPRKVTRMKYKQRVDVLLRQHRDALEAQSSGQPVNQVAVDLAHDELQELARTKLFIRNYLQGCLQPAATQSQSSQVAAEGTHFSL
mmetsp:Transcript_30848/g.57854  ORF Transcript_30848/g.57854 Transcript_30848/m.57854 type:complete len:219 (+) Transcript_30848:1-657(+)